MVYYTSIQSERLCLIHKRTVMLQLYMRHGLCWDNKCDAPSILQAIQPWITRKIRNNRSISNVIFIVKSNQLPYIIPNLVKERKYYVACSLLSIYWLCFCVKLQHSSLIRNRWMQADNRTILNFMANRITQRESAKRHQVLTCSHTP
jgi:hypothetical protein